MSLLYISPSGLNYSFTGEGPVTRIIPLHFFWSPVCSLFNQRDFRSCCIMSLHRFCRPLLPHPLTSAVINSFHGVLILSCHHMTVPSQSGLWYFVSNACYSSVFLMTSFLF